MQMPLRLHHQIRLLVSEVPLQASTARPLLGCSPIGWVRRAQHGSQIRLAMGVPTHGEDHALCVDELADARTIGRIHIVHRIGWTRIDVALPTDAIGMGQDRRLRLAQTRQRGDHRKRRRQGDRYHAPDMTQQSGWTRAWSRLAFWLCVAAVGPLGAELARQAGLGLQPTTCKPGSGFILLVLAPLAEEIIFRRGLHAWLATRLTRMWHGVSLPNLLVALLFGLLHALRHGSAAMLLTALPALLIGLAWERSGRQLRVAVAVHAWYNASLMLLSCNT